MMDSNDEAQARFFDAFKMEELIPEDHLQRSNHRFLNIDEMRAYAISIGPRWPVYTYLIDATTSHVINPHAISREYFDHTASSQ